MFMTENPENITPITTPEEPINQENISQEQETPEQINWKKFRQEKEKERQARAEAERLAAMKAQEAEALKAALDAVLNKPNGNQNYQESTEDELTQEEIIERKVKKALEEHSKQQLELQKQQEMQNFPQRLRADYKDFDQVCSADNLDYLDFHYPEVTAPFKYMPDGYEKWAAAYRAVKRFVANPNEKKDQAKAEKNFSKPQSMSVGGMTQTGDSAPIQMDDKRKADNWRRMQERMKGV